MRLFVAIRVFFRVLFDARLADRVVELLASQKTLPAMEQEQRTNRIASRPQQVAPHRPVRSEALTLLAALQREARLIDIVQESLDGYSDAQIGAAARDVLRDCRQVLERMFALRPVIETAEGSSWETPDAYDAGCYRLVGNVEGGPPYRGQVVHTGWQATRCELPRWSGSDAAACVLAPVELEVEGTPFKEDKR